MQKLSAVTVPDLGEDAEQVITISARLVSPGDHVSVDDDIVEVVTDKAAFTMPSPIAGRVARWKVSEGDEVKPGETILEMEIEI